MTPTFDAVLKEDDVFIQPINVIRVTTKNILKSNSIPNENDMSCEVVNFRETLRET